MASQKLLSGTEQKDNKLKFKKRLSSHTHAVTLFSSPTHTHTHTRRASFFIRLVIFVRRFPLSTAVGGGRSSARSSPLCTCVCVRVLFIFVLYKFLYFLFCRFVVSSCFAGNFFFARAPLSCRRVNAFFKFPTAAGIARGLFV